MTQNTCTRCAAPIKHRRKYCGHTCANRDRAEAYSQRVQAARSPRPACEVNGCDIDVRSPFATLCNTHYFRLRRTGDVGPATIHVKERGICQYPNCGRRVTMNGWCLLHGRRLAKGGYADYIPEPRTLDANSSWTGDTATYNAVHQRLHEWQGSASAYSCVDCGKQARHWSYDHQADNEQQSDFGAYTVDLKHYEPRCVSCHKTHDLHLINSRATSHLPSGQ